MGKASKFIFVIRFKAILLNRITRISKLNHDI
jgi:hypothetical protein